ncbi:hypothetical protein BO94DRAFT_499303 [Aspergillus sclerotioniger CBS 115572]|uniref:Zn(2)-C6 fungal-type domain-containing protein n=1 Tax=Aspergillus sclerotioniger CBS 115572 TaxID=1450535 RepID=A0A317VVR2_9EURO|nr:hypothetical protein BO94DRAFT_499303 [Aspergillus sclerotioniger CBS 115572]PWY75990.1 hypothetical protein BO94DRAFT_499303 [Aspergillus sclerotioniger CBS 115572]
MDHHDRPRRPAHRRSRRGCGNCKLRSVKCDETKPVCRRCLAYGVSCTYASTGPLQASVERVVTMAQPFGLSYWVDTNDFLLSRFQVRTALTVSHGRSRQVLQNEVMQLARSTPYLRHAILTLVLMHDRHALDGSRPSMNLAESDHWDRALTGFNRKMSLGFPPKETGAVLTTAAILWFLVFCHVEARTPEDAWPLRCTAAVGPAWLQINGGKEEIWRVMPSSSSDPVADALAPYQLSKLFPGEPEALDLSKVPMAFTRLFGLSTASPGVDCSPYREVAVDVAQALYMDRPVFTNILSFVNCLRTMTPRFKRLLLERDPRALLLLGCWYWKARQLGVWWMNRRAWLEGDAICLYLERHFSDIDDIHTILSFLRQGFDRGQSGLSVEGVGSPPAHQPVGRLVDAML